MRTCLTDVYYNWQETEQLRAALEKEVLKLEVEFHDVSLDLMCILNTLIGCAAHFEILWEVHSWFTFHWLLCRGKVGPVIAHHLPRVNLRILGWKVIPIIWKYLMMGLMSGKLILNIWSLGAKLLLGHMVICKFITCARMLILCLHARFNTSILSDPGTEVHIVVKMWLLKSLSPNV